MRSTDSSRQFDIHPAEQLVVARFGGPLDFHHILAWFDELSRAPGFCREFDGIVDLRAATLMSRSPENAQQLATRMIERELSCGRWVILASGPLETALSLVYRKVASAQHPLEIFSTAQAAAAYLERPLPLLEELLQSVCQPA